MGLQREAAGRGTLAIYIQIIFASILEQIFFHTTPSVLSVAGTIIILGSAIYVALTKQSSQSQVLATEGRTVEPLGIPPSDLNSDFEQGSSELDRIALLQPENQRVKSLRNMEPTRI
ncbi:hypothetical protein DFH11DRAFT_357479 [Phellopilus nigrolimitatus]|nr:hypothetical protein DFH11DRAFT_357479 [Phellopilus nigrolimitatus]